MEQDRLRKQIGLLENEINELRKQQKQEKLNVQYNPPGLRLVSMSLSRVVLSDEDGYRYFLGKNDPIMYDRKRFVLAEIQFGKQARFVSNAPGQEPETLIFLMINEQRFPGGQDRSRVTVAEPLSKVQGNPSQNSQQQDAFPGVPPLVVKEAIKDSAPEKKSVVPSTTNKKPQRPGENANKK